MILVCGATGTTGGAVLRQLRGDQQPVRATTRSAQSAERLRGDGVEAVVADLADPDSLGPALEGVDAVYVAHPATDQLAEHEGNLAQAAAAAGVRHIVKLSAIGAAQDSPMAFGRLHGQAEAAVRAAGVPFTMLRASGFMQNTLAWAAQIPSGTIRGPVMNARWAILDVRDIAAVAARVLESGAEHAGQAYTLTGPEASSPHEQVEILAEVLERPLESIEVPVQAAQEQMRSAGLPAQTAERLGELWRMYAEGRAEEISPDVERVTRRAPYTYRQFAEDHHTLWMED
ncbi:MAG: NmrA family NAD(P)-binding protein [Solirubrobacteraceae bacterium]